MFGFCYLLVPLYSLLCKATGINGKTTNNPTQLPSSIHVDNTRNITVLFASTIHGDLGFIFKPLQRKLILHPGETKLIYYFARNLSGHDITIQAIPSITPGYAAKYLKKTQCFCFTQQYFFNGEKADMPVFFYIDPNIPKRVHDMTLTYTLFDVTQQLKKPKIPNFGRIDL